MDVSPVRWCVWRALVRARAIRDARTLALCVVDARTLALCVVRLITACADGPRAAAESLSAGVGSRVREACAVRLHH